MANNFNNNIVVDQDQELLDYEDDDFKIGGDVFGCNNSNKRGGHVSIHSSGFRDFLLKPELLRAIVDCGFEHPRYYNCCFFLNLIFINN